MEGYLASGVVSLKGKKSSLDSACQAVVERDVTRFNRDGELTGFFAVHGGYAGATGTQYIAQNLHRCVAARPEYEEELYLALEKGMLDCQTGLYQQWNRSGLMHGSNSTVMVVRDGFCLFVNAGTGMAVLGGVDGALRVLTSPSARFDELESFTCHKYLPDCEDEFVILGCDGFWEKMEPAQSVRMVRSALRKYRSVKYASEKLSYAAQVAGARRNINVIVVVLNADVALGIPPDANEDERRSILSELDGHVRRTMSAGKDTLQRALSDGKSDRTRSFDSISDTSSVTTSTSAALLAGRRHGLLSPKLSRVPPQVCSPSKQSSRLVIRPSSGASTPKHHGQDDDMSCPPEPDIATPRAHIFSKTTRVTQLKNKAQAQT